MNSATPASERPDPEQAGLVWMDTQRAMIALWNGEEPTVEWLASGVPPRRKAVGSVRRGPVRPEGGGRVGGEGTETRHLELLQQYLGELTERLADLDAIEVIGRGHAHERLAELLRTLSASGADDVTVTTQTVSRRPSERQLMARFRKLVGRELPRRTRGPYGGPAAPPTDASGRVRTPTAAERRRNPKPRHLPEREHIDHEIEMMLADEPSAADLMNR
jgi:hypothetical protein